MNAEEFILIPKERYLQDRPITEQILYNPDIGQKKMQLSLLQRNVIDQNKSVEENANDVSITDERAKQLKDDIFKQISTLNDNQKKKSDFIFSQIEKSEKLIIDDDGILHVEGAPTGLPVSTFLYTLQQPNKKFNEKLYKTILNYMNVPEHLVANAVAKRILRGEEEEEPVQKTPIGSSSKKRKPWEGYKR